VVGYSYPIARFANRKEKYIMSKSFVISVLKDGYKVCRLNAFDGVPDWALDSPLSSVTRTAEELSIVCPDQVAPDEFKSEHEWKCLKIHGPLGFDEVGIISSLTRVLANADISVFVLSTFETDYILVKKMNIEKAAKVLSDSGHEIFFD
jgi:hypothetical protein